MKIDVNLLREDGSSAVSKHIQFQKLGVSYDDLEDILNSLAEKLLHSETLYTMNEGGEAQFISLLSHYSSQNGDERDYLTRMLIATKANGERIVLNGIALSPATPEIISLNVENLEEAESIFKSWMPAGANYVESGGYYTWHVRDAEGNTLGDVTFTPLSNDAQGVIAKVTFDKAVKPELISEYRFFDNKSWPLNGSELKHRKGEIKIFKTIDWKYTKEDDNDSAVPVGTRDAEFRCISDNYTYTASYFVHIQPYTVDWYGNSMDVINKYRDYLAYQSVAATALKSIFRIYFDGRFMKEEERKKIWEELGLKCYRGDWVGKEFLCSNYNEGFIDTVDYVEITKQDDDGEYGVRGCFWGATWTNRYPIYVHAYKGDELAY